MSGRKDGEVAARRGLLRALGMGSAAAAAGIGTAAAQRADAVPAKDARKESEAIRVAARYRETDHVKAFYRTNAYEH
ncbi:hypothetical protein [Paracraurococcus lichenis]|uniref:Formate dehydrogenase n=1 Tax=Paracraurococcus lichenis TaxID=3064888 RepID=A0ABT9DWB6_9PROT|nr:hypothetical protein [Paracraurococcus sp. LOR1-02]MDO9708189.1 hypothetical protein [Paracraurococcus sp. LOR1-02]